MDIFKKGFELCDIYSFILHQRNECLRKGNYLCLIFIFFSCVIFFLPFKECLEVFLSFYLCVALSELL